MCFSRDGCYAWCDTAEVFDVKTKQRVAQWTNRADGEGSPVMSSEFFEVHRRGGDVDFVGHQMGSATSEQSNRSLVGHCNFQTRMTSLLPPARYRPLGLMARHIMLSS
ncbi:hypothetical protein Pla8534_43530 [Lignipirellula cremea]|uniref:Uncharacterized protein n=1 Tax=Lignipirellula cremea TaxID=2528010 RepID=A0A518DXH3_9BACT|nr:hypothetical protein Pla8534_43530 [Lignipirellula cremea]